MAWHLGYPLSQTLFTSVYVEALLMPDPRSILEAQFVRDPHDESHKHPMLKILRAYCMGMLKACGYVNERIRSEHFYEVWQLSTLKVIPGADINQGRGLCDEYLPQNAFGQPIAK